MFLGTPKPAVDVRSEGGPVRTFPSNVRVGHHLLAFGVKSLGNLEDYALNFTVKLIQGCDNIQIPIIS